MSHKQVQPDENVYLENTQNTSNKFFHIQLKHKTIAKQYGKINSSGQTQEKKYPSVKDAEKEFQHIIQSKLKKGYVRIYKQERNTKPIVHLPSKPKLTVSIIFQTLPTKQNRDIAHTQNQLTPR